MGGKTEERKKKGRRIGGARPFSPGRCEAGLIGSKPP